MTFFSSFPPICPSGGIGECDKATRYFNTMRIRHLWMAILFVFVDGSCWGRETGIGSGEIFVAYGIGTLKLIPKRKLSVLFPKGILRETVV
jgi:hypothetical protein